MCWFFIPGSSCMIEGSADLLPVCLEDLLAARQEVRERDRLIAELRVALAAQRHETRLSQHRLSEIEESTAWRVTSPVRHMARYVPKIVHRSLRRGFQQVRRWRSRATDEQAAPVPIPGAEYTYRPPARLNDRVLSTGRARTDGPMFSIVMGLSASDFGTIIRLVASLRCQWYENWQWVLIADRIDPLVQALLEALQDTRIVYRAIEGTMVERMASGWRESRGEYVIFLREDDELTEDCLYELDIALTSVSADVVYSDEDILDENGAVVPYFKPDWSPDTLMSLPYIGHACAIRRTLLDDAGGVSSACSDGPFWDVLLRVTERAQRILHVPKVLYHRRGQAAVEPGVMARTAALARRGAAGRLEPVPEAPGYFRVVYAATGTPLISIIIPTRDHGAMLLRNIDSVRNVAAWQDVEFVILDNGSRDGETRDILDNLSTNSRVSVIRHDRPFNYAELNNIGARRAQGELLLFMNDDMTLLTADALERMAGLAQRKHIGAVGAKLLYPEGQGIQHVGVMNIGYGPVHAMKGCAAEDCGAFMRAVLDYDWSSVTGACLMIERTKFDAVGGFDEELPIAYNDSDLCFRLIERGLFNVVCPAAQFLHYESFSRAKDDDTPRRRSRLDADRQRLEARHRDILARDPFHNPNFDPKSAYFMTGRQ